MDVNLVSRRKGWGCTFLQTLGCVVGALSIVAVSAMFVPMSRSRGGLVSSGMLLFARGGTPGEGNVTWVAINNRSTVPLNDVNNASLYRDTPQNGGWLLSPVATGRLLIANSRAWGPPGFYRDNETSALLLDPSWRRRRALAPDTHRAGESTALAQCLALIQGHLDLHRISLRHALHPLVALGVNSAPSSVLRAAFVGTAKTASAALLACVNTVLAKAAIPDQDSDLEVLISINQLLLLVDGGRDAFVFVIPSHNNVESLAINLGSVLAQSYPPRLIRLIYVDDDSDDGTPEAVAQFLEAHGMLQQATLLRTHHHAGPGYSRLLAYHRAFDDEIVAMLDGDDWLFDGGVLDAVESHYKAHGLLASYGGYYVFKGGEDKALGRTYGGGRWLMCARQYPPELRASRAYTHRPWFGCHLRTARAVAFKAIEYRHVLGPDGLVARVNSDIAEMVPVLQLAGDRHRNIQRPTYIYNRENSQRYATSFYRMGSEPELRRYRTGVLERLAQRPIYPVLGVWVQAPIGEAPCVAALGGGDDQGGGSSKRTEARRLADLARAAQRRPEQQRGGCAYVHPSSLPPAEAERLLPLAAQTKALVTLDLSGAAPAAAALAAAAAEACTAAAVPLDDSGSIVLVALAANPGCAAVLRLELPPGSARAGGGKGGLGSAAHPLPAGVYTAALLQEVQAQPSRLLEHVVVLVLPPRVALPSPSPAPATPGLQKGATSGVAGLLAAPVGGKQPRPLTPGSRPKHLKRHNPEIDDEWLI